MVLVPGRVAVPCYECVQHNSQIDGDSRRAGTDCRAVRGAISGERRCSGTGEAASAIPPRAQKAIQAGKKAENSGDWQTAYEDYSEALKDAPGNKEAELLRDAARFRLVLAAHGRRGTRTAGRK